MSGAERKSKFPWTSPVADGAGVRKLRHADTGTEFSVNVQRSGRIVELVMKDPSAPEDRRWLSVLVNRDNGQIETGKDGMTKEACALAKAQMSP